jgi:hypothetical protein
MSHWGGLNLWLAPILVAILLMIVTASYVRARWRQAPVAFAAMKFVGGLFFLSGLLSGISIFHLIAERSEVAPASSMTAASIMPRPIVPGPSTSSPIVLPAKVSGNSVANPDASVSALEAGREIAATYAAHASDPSWSSAETIARNCDRGVLQADSLPCRAAYLALHSNGNDLDRGPQASTVSLTDIAAFCDNLVIVLSSSLCKRAYAAQNAGRR